MINTSEGISALTYLLVSYHCPQWSNAGQKRASSIHHAAMWGNVFGLWILLEESLWRIDCAILIAYKQEPSSSQLTSLQIVALD